jgi:hypothetical protein
MSKYKPVIQMLIEQNRALGYLPFSLQDEEETALISPKYTDALIVQHATDVEQCCITFINLDIPSGVFGRLLRFYIVLGNDLYETIADHTDHGVAERIAAHIESSF